MPYDRDPDENSTRSVQTPDGDYLVTMSGAFWNSLDWMDENTTWSNSRILEIAWTCAKENQNDGTMRHPDSFQQELTHMLKGTISYRAKWFEHESNGASNAP